MGALIENINLDTGSRSLQYTFKLYDKSNVLLGKRTGRTFLLPSEKVLLFEPTIVTGASIPTNLEFRIDSVEWEPLRGIKPLDVDGISKTFRQDPHPTVTAVLFNRSFFEEPKIEVLVMFERSDGNVYAVSRTLVENFTSDSSRTITFTWPTSSLEKPANISFIIRPILYGF